MEFHQLNQFSGQINDHLFGHILPFWCGPALDHENGGWTAWLSNDLKSDRTQPKGLVVNSQILWTFSATHRRKPESIYRQMAERAFEFVTLHFWDAGHGGVFRRVDDNGQVIEDIKKIYGQAFCLHAFSEYYQAFGTQAALDRAIQIFELLENHAHDSKHTGYFEVRSRDWSKVLDDSNRKKSMNTHLRMLEAYTNLFRIWENPRVEQRLRELIQIFLEQILDPRTFHFHHYFDEQWRVRADTYIFGHDLEGSWLLCQAAETLGDEGLIEGLRAVALRIADTVLREAVDPSGGISSGGCDGKVIDSKKEWWSQAEAVVAFLNAFQISKEAHYLEAALRAWNYIDEYLVDRTHGEWFWCIDEDGKPDPTLPKMSECKGPYHGSRMCLEILRRGQRLGA